jgi:hypothetical protein
MKCNVSWCQNSGLHGLHGNGFVFLTITVDYHLYCSVTAINSEYTSQC